MPEQQYVKGSKGVGVPKAAIIMFQIDLDKP